VHRRQGQPGPRPGPDRPRQGCGDDAQDQACGGDPVPGTGALPRVTSSSRVPSRAGPTIATRTRNGPISIADCPGGWATMSAPAARARRHTSRLALLDS
jgi:hypothetical protein